MVAVFLFILGGAGGGASAIGQVVVVVVVMAGYFGDGGRALSNTNKIKVEKSKNHTF